MTHCHTRQRRRLYSAPLRLLFLLLPLLLGCAAIDTRGRAPVLSLPAAEHGVIASSVDELGMAAGESSFRLLQANADSLLLRLRSAETAVSSIDAMYYIWHNDVSGRLLAAELLRAADRGVRVRVLIDDMSVRHLDLLLAAVDAHPNLEIRIYNPFRTRASRVGNVFEFVLSGFRLNHRMHNKAWIVDGHMVILGGRNIGDEYFGVHEGFNFRDLGVLLSGAAAATASADFDAYWNTAISVEVARLRRQPPPETALARAQDVLAAERVQSLASEPIRGIVKDGDVRQRIESGAGRFFGQRVRVINDPPEKWRLRGPEPVGVAAEIERMMAGAQREVIVMSPYFVPGRRGARQFAALEQRGVQVRVLTNSLAATDVAAVHGGYARYRRGLLQAGVEIHELKRSAGLPLERSFRGSSRASLHSKAVIVDGRMAYIGSYNLDPRSTWINTESGVVIDDARFAELVRQDYLHALDPEHSFAVTLEGGRIHWSDVYAGQARKQTREPTRSWSRRIIALLARVLPVERHL